MAEQEVLDARSPDGETRERWSYPEDETFPRLNSGAQAALYSALAVAQGQFPPIPRDRTVKVKTRDGGSYTFSYAPLDTILNAVRPALAENSLALTQVLDGVEDAHTVLRTRLLHSAGGCIESVWPISSRGTPQEFGSALTYLRRYTLVALLGIASEEDDDGNHASGNTATATQEPRSVAADASGKPEAGSQHDKDQKAAHAIKRKLIEAGLTQEQFEAGLVADFGTGHINELTAEQCHTLVAKLREAEKAITKEKP